MARKSRAARKKRSNEMLMVMGLGVFLTAVLSGIAYLFMHRTTAPDKLTMCPATGPIGHYVVLVDNTDPYTFIQRQAFVEGLKSLAEDVVPEGYLLTVYALGEDFTENATPILEKCNPGDATLKSEMTSNLKRIQSRFENEFRQPVAKLEDVLMLDKPSDKSPIFEMLQIAAINGFRAKNVHGPKVLIVYSDMLPNTPEFSMFKGLPEFSAFADSTYGKRSLTDMEGVRVELNYLLNYPELQNRKQLGFWEHYFEKAGARIVEVRTLEG